MQRLLIISGFLFFFSGYLHSQTKIIDSLKQYVYRANNDREKLQAILNLCEEFKSLHRDTLDYYSTLARKLAAKSGDKRTKDLAEFAVANTYSRWGWMDSAIIIIDPVIKSNPVNDPKSRDLYFKFSRQKALYHGGRSRYPETLSILYQLVKEAQLYRDTLTMGANLNTIGSVSLQRDEPQLALRWFRRAEAMSTHDQRYMPIAAAIYVNMADAFNQLGNVDSAASYIGKGVELFRSTENLMSLAHALQKKSSILLAAKKTDQAEAALKEMISTRQQMNDGAMWVDDNLTLVDFYLETNQADKAIAFCKAALAPNPDSLKGTEAISYVTNVNLRLNYYEALAKSYKAANMPAEYQQTLEQIILAKDSFYQAEADAELQAKYDVQKKENKIIQQEFDLTRKNYWLYGSLALLFFAGLLAYVLFSGYKKRQRIKTKLLLENEKIISQQAVMQAEENERKRIAADLHDNLGAYAASIASNLDIIKTEVSKDQGAVALDQLHENSQAMVSQLSDTIWALNKYSLTLTAISDRLKVFMRRLQPSYPSINMEVQEKIVVDVSLPPTQAFHLFQIIQEAITNAVKHSGANVVSILVQGNSHTDWSIIVADNGKGMNLADNSRHSGGGNGLASMKKRAGIAGWEINWLPNQPSGTKVMIGSTTN